MEKEEIYKKAIEIWGIWPQLDMLVEESSELIQAVQKLKRNRSVNPISLVVDKYHYNLIEELADVEIMCEQIKIFFGENEVHLEKMRKLERLEKTLKKIEG